MDIGLQAWHVWTIIALCLFISEVFMPGFILASLGIGALAGAAAHHFSGELGWGLAGFAAGAGVSLVLIRPYIATVLGPEEHTKFGADSMIGDRITISDASDVGGSLKARYRDTQWSLRCDQEVFEGDTVVITGVDGATLIVQRTEET